MIRWTARMPSALLVASLAMLAGCGDGSVRSPGFASETTIERVYIEPAGNVSTPAGTELDLRAFAEISTTVPPGTPDAEDGVLQVIEEVTDRADWSSSNTNVASVDTGRVSGVVAGQSTIEARFEGFKDDVALTVSEAVLEAVSHIQPIGEPRSDDDSYSFLQGTQTNFAIFGQFSDGQLRQLTPSNFEVDWSSNDTSIADNPDPEAANRFEASGIGSTTILGELTDSPGVNPASASATLSVSPRSEVCTSEFFAPGAIVVSDASTLCIGCSLEQPGAVIDGNDETFGTLEIPLGLLLASTVSVTVSDADRQPFVVGEPAAFLVSRSSSLLSLELLSNVEVATVSCDINGENCTELERFGASNGLPLKLSLLGVIGDEEVRLLSTPELGAESAEANGLRLDFSGGLLSAAATLNVHASCAIGRPPAE